MNYPQIQIPQNRNVPRSRPMMVSDPRKLSYFAQANGARFGITNGQGAAGSLGGLGDTLSAEEAARAASASGVKTGTDVATVFGTFLNTLLGSKSGDTTPPPSQYTLPKDNTFLGVPQVALIIGGVAIAGFIGYKVLKKK